MSAPRISLQDGARPIFSRVTGLYGCNNKRRPSNREFWPVTYYDHYLDSRVRAIVMHQQL